MHILLAGHPQVAVLRVIEGLLDASDTTRLRLRVFMRVT